MNLNRTFLSGILIKRVAPWLGILGGMLSILFFYSPSTVGLPTFIVYWMCGWEYLGAFLLLCSAGLLMDFPDAETFLYAFGMYGSLSPVGVCLTVPAVLFRTLGYLHMVRRRKRLLSRLGRYGQWKTLARDEKLFKQSLKSYPNGDEMREKLLSEAKRCREARESLLDQTIRDETNELIYQGNSDLYIHKKLFAEENSNDPVE